jgi:hypothetical protein
MPVLLLSMLAGFGLVILQRVLPPRLRSFIWIIPLVLIIEYSSFPLAYQRVDWENTPPVYQWLSKQDDDFAILEWPSNNEGIDSKYVFWSLKHKKMEVTGVSGFFPPFTRQVVKAMVRFPSPDSIAWLRQIYPLKYLIIHGDNFFKPEHQQLAAAWTTDVPKGLALARQFAQTSVFKFIDKPETLGTWERTFSTALVSKKPVASFTLVKIKKNRKNLNAPLVVEVVFNGRTIKQITVESTQKYQISLPGPYPAAERNIFHLKARGHGSNIVVSGFKLSKQ